ncbi:MAG TPA: acetate uptake transporter [Thermoplasmata archaeon]|nr:acetate uptake transporter [Thermoplasmata archaeon]
MSQMTAPSPTSLNEKALLADPAPLGLAGFAFTTFLLSFVNTGWLGASAVGVVVPLALFYGGLGQLLAGVFEMRKGNTFGFTAFSSYGAFWLFFGSLVLLEKMGLIAPPAVAVGTALLLYGIFTFYMWIPAMFANLSLNLTFLFLWLAFVFLGLGDVLPSTMATTAGGYFGIFSATAAAYTSFAIVTNSNLGAGTIPLGPGLRRRAKAVRAPYVGAQSHP